MRTHTTRRQAMPRTETITRTLYTFDELSEEAKEKAISDNRDINVGDDYWYECIYEDAKTIASLMGITIERIYFRGFWSQGDGACFEGYYSYEKGGVKKVKEHAPKDEELHRIAKELQNIQKRYFYGIHAKVRQSGHYMHERCTNFTIEFNEHPNGGYWENTIEAENELAETLRDFMKWIYKALEAEYNYQTSDEQIAEYLEGNQIEFLEDGSQA